jgi:hypothetical protein
MKLLVDDRDVVEYRLRAVSAQTGCESFDPLAAAKRSLASWFAMTLVRCQLETDRHEWGAQVSGQGKQRYPMCLPGPC